jgi:hypothetical protein
MNRGHWGWASVVAVVLGCGDGGSGPSAAVEIIEPASTEVVVGEFLDLEGMMSGAGAAVWSSADTSVAEVSGVTLSAVVEARRPGQAGIELRTEDASDTLVVTVLARDGGYPTASIDYFAEIGLGAEFGSPSRLVRRWAEGPRVRVNGAPTPEDRTTLDSVVSDIDGLTTTVDMAIVDTLPTVELHFAPQSSFADILPSYVPGNVGFFTVWWDASQAIVQAVVLVSTDIDQTARNHIIREEVTQILGLMQDSYRYPESIFQQSWTLVDRYAPIDEDLIEMLYRPELPIGALPEVAVRTLRRLTRDGPVAVPLASAPRTRAPLGVPGTASGGEGLR